MAKGLHLHVGRAGNLVALLLVAGNGQIQFTWVKTVTSVVILLWDWWRDPTIVGKGAVWCELGWASPWCELELWRSSSWDTWEEAPASSTSTKDSPSLSASETVSTTNPIVGNVSVLNPIGNDFSWAPPYCFFGNDTG